MDTPLCAQPNELRIGQIGGSSISSLYVSSNYSRKFLSGAATIGSATITFWMRDDLTPWNLDATFTVSYNTMSDSTLIFFCIRHLLPSCDYHLDICHTTQKTYKLPLKLVARPVQQMPSAATAGQCKITLGANKPVVDLGSLFSGKEKIIPKNQQLFIFSFVELAMGDNNQQGLITRFYGSNENISILTSSKSRIDP